MHAIAPWNRASQRPVLQSQARRLSLEKSFIFTAQTERVAAVMWYFLAVCQNVNVNVNMCIGRGRSRSRRVR